MYTTCVASLNAILYVDRTGIPWRYLPHDCPPCATAYGYFVHWQNTQLGGMLRRSVRRSRAITPSRPRA
ncbi:transposase [Microtetraspora fusca]|uniref:transposase n=1 Tax=Microtetraspora fusca TaxID=1997 RepID=UPI001C3F1849